MTQRIALIGNPNTGKTSLFNRLTGSFAHVGNWSGVTVEQKVGQLHGNIGQLIDLPGVYDLDPLSADEAIVSRFLLQEPFDGLFNIIDASQFERNLQLTLQLLEMGRPLQIGLNMVDVAEGRGITINLERLRERLNVDIFPITARTGAGCDVLLSSLQSKPRDPFILDYGQDTERAIQQILDAIGRSDRDRWVAVQYLAGNRVISELLESSAPTVLAIRKTLEMKLGRFAHAHITERRREWTKDVRQHVVEERNTRRVTLTDRIDAVVTHPIWGLPIFFAVLYSLFHITFNWVGAPLSDVLDGLLTGPLTSGTSWLLQTLGTSSFIQALIIEGVIAGVGGVLVFVPQIFVLFFFISFLEDSGYMARVAIVMDRFMQLVGLNGKSFIPMIIGFGCNVPGIMAARTIEEERERLVTIFISPFMSCSARLPIYAVFAASFFASNQALVVLSLYMLGIILALIIAKIFTSLLAAEDRNSLFIVEQPPYRVPQGLTLWRSTWQKAKGFVRKAGTFIFGGSVFIWLLAYSGPNGFDVPMDESFLAMVGGVIATLLVPLGFGTWQAGAALITGFLAKEVVVSTMAIIYAVSESDLSASLFPVFTPLSAYSFMAFVLLYVPCLATVAVIRREVGSAKLTWVASLYGLGVAYVVSLLIYQIGRLLGFS
ncbi:MULTISPECIES: ferrous iron transport protein B [unclassified Exiguobacterium]|uniref:ferrous iron transport protein B n=1 Tax=unclassified Exiguobacterium TaxID=2644629 RepID=UPI001BE506BA|nr:MULTISPECIES: ferrous iron transport protein B [unclassified Exiguobacterium]